MEIDLETLALSPLYLVVLGVGVGILSGLLGVGGGILLTPALHILGLPMPAAVATTLTQMVGSSLSGSYKHMRHGHVSMKLALLLGLPSLLGMTLGRELLLSWTLPYADRILSNIYLGLMLLVCANFLREWWRGSAAPPNAHIHRWMQLGPKIYFGANRKSAAIIPGVVLGIGVGLISSLTGLGGGFLYIPLLTLLAACSMKEAIGTSLAAVFFSSLYGAIVYGVAGISNLPTALFLMVGSICGAQLGASAAHKAQNQRLKLLFLLLVLTAVFSMILKRLGWELAAHILLFGGGLMIVLMALFLVFLAPRKKLP